jgi:hypothetical protein
MKRNTVIPAQAGTHSEHAPLKKFTMGPRLREGDAGHGEYR